MRSITFKKETENDFILKVFFFILNPILGVFAALFRLNTKSSIAILFLAYVVFGMSITVPNRESNTMGFDAVRYRQDFESYIEKSAYNYKLEVREYVKLEGKPDIYHDTLNYVVSRISTNYHSVFLFASLICAIFFCKNMGFIVGNDAYRLSMRCVILTYLFFCAMHFFKITAFRFQTALTISIFFLFLYFLTKNKRYLIGLLIPPLIHASFLILIPIIITYLLTGKYFKFWIICMVVALFVSELSIELFKNSLQLLPASITQKFDGYLDAWYILEQNEGGSGRIWIKRLLELCFRMYLNLLVIIMWLNYNDRIKGTDCENIFKFLLVLMALVNFTMIIPSLGARFQLLTYPFIAYIWMRCFQLKRYDKYVYLLGVFLVGALFLPVSVSGLPCLNYYNKVLEPSFYYASPIYLILKNLVFY